jgi:hypothetical protein
MLKEKEFPVYGDNGLRGTLLSPARLLDPSPEKRVRLDDGRVIMVSSRSLIPQPDGSYYFRPTGADPEPRTSAAESAISEPDDRAQSEGRGYASTTQPETATARPEGPNLRQAAPETAPRPEGPNLRQSAPETAARPDAEPRQVFAPSAAGPLFREDCEVERVQVKRMLDQPAEIRQDGDTLIIPLMEEVLVIEKRLMLREELHIRRRRETKADNDRIPIPSNQLAQ